MSLIDKQLFESRSASGCSNSDYNLLRTTCCNSFLVEDDELLDYYLDPLNLKNIARLEKDDPCPFCGKKKWEFINVDEFKEMPESWKWAAPIDLQNKQRKQ